MKAVEIVALQMWAFAVVDARLTTSRVGSLRHWSRECSSARATLSRGRDARAKCGACSEAAGWIPPRFPDSEGGNPIRIRAPLHRLVSTEVKYRRNVLGYLQHEGRRGLAEASCWPDLYLILVTDRPEPERSCFQVLQ
jgi:hypothetical protein